MHRYACFFLNQISPGGDSLHIALILDEASIALRNHPFTSFFISNIDLLDFVTHTFQYQRNCQVYLRKNPPGSRNWKLKMFDNSMLPSQRIKLLFSHCKIWTLSQNRGSFSDCASNMLLLIQNYREDAPLVQENRGHVEEGARKLSYKPNVRRQWEWYKYLPRGTGLASLQAVWYFVMFGSSSSGRSSGRSSGSGKRMLLIGTTLS